MLGCPAYCTSHLKFLNFFFPWSLRKKLCRESAQSEFLMHEAGLEDAVQEHVECASAAKGIELKKLDHRQSEIKHHKTHIV